MNATAELTETAESTEPQVSVLEQAHIVSGLLKEYAEKLSALNDELIDTVTYQGASLTEQRVAWLLDRGELLRKPLSQIISRGSALLQYSSPEAIAKLKDVAPLREHARLDSLTADELALRMREIEIHLHHMIRLTHELRQTLPEYNRKLPDDVAKLRLAAGLNAMKGGPLHPE